MKREEGLFFLRLRRLLAYKNLEKAVIDCLPENKEDEEKKKEPLDWQTEEMKE